MADILNIGRLTWAGAGPGAGAGAGVGAGAAPGAGAGVGAGAAPGAGAGVDAGAGTGDGSIKSSLGFLVFLYTARVHSQTTLLTVECLTT